jgi:fatty acid desaturase
MSVKLLNQRQARSRASDAFAGDVPVRLTKQELGQLSRINTVVSCLHIGGEWSLIVGTIYLCEWLGNPLLYLLAVVFLGARQHALLILMHDGVHYRLFKNRPLNDWATEVLLAWPCLVSARAYRRNHFRHHRYLNTDQDPDWARKHGDPAWEFPKRPSRLASLLLRDLSGLGAIAFLRLLRTVTSEDSAAGRGIIVSRYVFYFVTTLVLFWTGAIELFLQYWIVPMFTWLIVILRVRSIAEHSAIQGSYNKNAQTRTTYVTLIERIFIASKNVNYHTEHHFYPSVPFYRLSELHTLLISKPGFRDAAHVTQTYWGVLKEAVGGTADNFPALPGLGVEIARNASTNE